ncbi:unnamed protein product, partial [Discosporangium mesarthrocarpum]
FGGLGGAHFPLLSTLVFRSRFFCLAFWGFLCALIWQLRDFSFCPGGRTMSSSPYGLGPEAQRQAKGPRSHRRIWKAYHAPLLRSSLERQYGRPVQVDEALWGDMVGGKLTELVEKERADTREEFGTTDLGEGLTKLLRKDGGGQADGHLPGVAVPSCSSFAVVGWVLNRLVLSCYLLFRLNACLVSRTGTKHQPNNMNANLWAHILQRALRDL